MVLIKLISFLLISVSLPLLAQTTPAPDLSFRKMVLSQSSIDIGDQITSKCRSSILGFIRSDKRFFSSIIQKNIYRKSEFPFLGSDNGKVFYHYTNSKAVQEIALKNHYVEMFSYLRTKPNVMKNEVNVYVADDPVSSSHYGSILVKFFLKDELNILAESQISQFDSRGIIARDVIANNEELNECSANLNDYTLIYYLVLEEMSVDVVHYTVAIPEVNGHWFQIFNPYSIDHLELGNQTFLNIGFKSSTY